jgi:hypothetical protein
MCHAWRFIEIHGALAAPTVIGVLHVDIPRADPRNLSRRAFAVQLQIMKIFRAM